MQQKATPNRTDTDIIQSASVTALFRAVLADEVGLKKNPDYLAKYFVNENWSNYLSDPKQSSIALEERLPGCTYYLLIRTKYFDQSLLDWLETNPDSQIVMLGTGFDTRSLRFAEKMRGAKTYEIDLKAMLNYKKNIIEKFSLENEKTNKSYVPIDFHKENIFEKLSDHGFDFSKPTYFLMEGVTYFLEKQTVETLLSEISDKMKAHASFTFDYAMEDYINGELSYHGAKEINFELEQIGEPHLFGVDFENFENFVTNKKYKVINNFTAQMLEALYLTEKNGDSVGRPHTFYSLATIGI